jgi:acyl carrier protein
MAQSEVLKQVNDIFIDILDIDYIVLTTETTARDIDEWDSLSHIQLIVAIEKYFKIKFTTQEIQNLKNIGDMCNLIEKKCSK